MGESSKKVSFTSAPKENDALTAEIRDFIRKQRDSDLCLASRKDRIEEARGRLGEFLERLYIHICEFGSYEGSAATPDKKILAAWESFLGPINALAGVEANGHMIAARMILYLTQSYRQNGQLPRKLPMSASSSKPIAMRCNFLVSLDDTLLSCLTHIWREGDKRDMFNWVFTDYPVHICGCRHGGTCQDSASPGQSIKEYHEQRKRAHIRTASITDPADLVPENGVRSRWHWTRAEGDTAQYPRHPESYRAGYDESADGERLLMWQDIGSDGPIRESYRYDLEDEDTGATHGRDRAALRRSRQFVLDARRIAKCNLARDSRRIAQVAMARRSLPAELQNEVFEYLGEIQEHPYINSRVDLSAIYRPFPDISKKCSHCPGRANSSADKTAKSTCLLNSITVWSLPLRIFHTFHQTGDGNWQLCCHIDCAGHHRDASWRLRNSTVEDHLNNIVQSRCGQGLKIKDIGLGPLSPVKLPTEAEDRARDWRLFSGRWDDNEEQDTREEACWTGIIGLAGVMMHNKTLLGLHNSGRTTTDASWLFGRTRQDEARAGSALERGHVYCEYC